MSHKMCVAWVKCTLSLSKTDKKIVTKVKCTLYYNTYHIPYTQNLKKKNTHNLNSKYVFTKASIPTIFADFFFKRTRHVFTLNLSVERRNVYCASTTINSSFKRECAHDSLNWHWQSSSPENSINCDLLFDCFGGCQLRLEISSFSSVFFFFFFFFHCWHFITSRLMWVILMDFHLTFTLRYDNVSLTRFFCEF